MSEKAEKWGTHCKAIQRYVREHVNLPASLASGHLALSDKVSGEAWKMRLQTEDKPGALAEHASTYWAMASDMGTKLGIPDFQ